MPIYLNVTSNPESREPREEKVPCRCGFLTRPGPFCEKCGSPLKARHEARESAAFRPARRPPSAPQPTIAIHRDDTAGPREPLAPPGMVLCTWCGGHSAPGPGCEICGSPIETGNLVQREDVRFESGEAHPASGRGLRLITTPPDEEEEEDRPDRGVGA